MDAPYRCDSNSARIGSCLGAAVQPDSGVGCNKAQPTGSAASAAGTQIWTCADPQRRCHCARAARRRGSPAAERNVPTGILMRGTGRE